MSAHLRADPAAGHPARATRPYRWGCKPPLIVLALLVLAGCTRAPSTPVAGADPSDPAARVPPAGYRSTVAPYQRQRPVDPAPWRDQNDRVAPPTRE
jgi:hypothetical protein